MQQCDLNEIGKLAKGAQDEKKTRKQIMRAFPKKSLNTQKKSFCYLSNPCFVGRAKST